MAEQYIFTIENLSKAYGKREVLTNIWISFYPGAKIGVIGANGSGKSTLLRIMALEDTDFLGEAQPDGGITVGYVLGDPAADFDKLMEEMGKLQDVIDAQNLWELDRQLELAMDAMRLPPGD